MGLVSALALLQLAQVRVCAALVVSNRGAQEFGEGGRGVPRFASDTDMLKHEFAEAVKPQPRGLKFSGNKATPEKIRLMKERCPAGWIKLNNTFFLHPGKSGGGEFGERISSYKVNLKRCHPQPCDKEMFRTAGNSYAAIVTIRDPVDRFESGFNWSSEIMCKKVNETRSKSHDPWDDVTKFCLEVNESEFQTLHKYDLNPSKLAEVLCNDDESGEQARQDWHKIQHVRYNLVDWLPPYQRTDRLSAVVLEPGFDFDEQVDSAITAAVDDAVEAGAECIQDRQDDVQSGSSKARHSSSTHSLAPPLSALGTCCVAQFLKEDYQLINDLQSFACEGDSKDICEAALHSIFERRRVLLSSDLSCHAIADWIK